MLERLEITIGPATIGDVTFGTGAENEGLLKWNFHIDGECYRGDQLIDLASFETKCADYFNAIRVSIIRTMKQINTKPEQKG
jgi:hypothetical protein